MKSRLDYLTLIPSAIKPLRDLEAHLRSCGLNSSLLELVKIRVSQINGCAWCIDMHTKDARAGGETEQRIYMLDAWRETPFFTERERAALDWTESVTCVSETHVPDAVYDRVKEHFSEIELVNLTMAVIAINSWNRLAISFRKIPTPANIKSAEKQKSNNVLEHK